MAKVSFVNGSQSLIFIATSPISGIPKVLITACKTSILESFAYARNRTSVNNNQTLRPLYNRYLSHITVIKVSLNCTRTFSKWFLELFSFWNAYFNFNCISRWEGIELSSRFFFVDYHYTHRHQKIRGPGIGMILPKIYTPYPTPNQNSHFYYPNSCPLIRLFHN